jgi:CBS domain-containing protein
MLLTPKSEVAYIKDSFSIRQTLEKMEHYRYSALPIINNDGEYVGTITEGDLLWGIKNQFSLNRWDDLSHYSVMNIERHSDNRPVGINEKAEGLLEAAITQNFVPVIDDSNTFIGIVTRQKIMRHIAAKAE